jgi:hypothetical protein
VGKKRAKHRGHLFALGPWHQEHSDGHEKLGEQALQIGKGINLPIYATKDQFAAWLHALILMPNVRNAIAIAHYYLDLVEARGCEYHCVYSSCSFILLTRMLDMISIQITVDQGSEVREMLKIHERLRSVTPKIHLGDSR